MQFPRMDLKVDATIFMPLKASIDELYVVQKRRSTILRESLFPQLMDRDCRYELESILCQLKLSIFIESKCSTLDL